jgi:hypothetical protein
LTFDHVVTLIIFILPGYFASSVYGFFLIDRKSSSFEKTSLSIFFSLFIYSIFVFIPYFDVNFVYRIIAHKADKLFLINKDFLIHIWLLLIFSFFIGFIASKIISNRAFIIRFSKIFKRSYFKRVWDEVFYIKQPQWVYVKTNSGDQIIGKPESITDYPGDKELYLNNAQKITQDDNMTYLREAINGQGVLLNMNSIEYIIFIE